MWVSPTVSEKIATRILLASVLVRSLQAARGSAPASRQSWQTSSAKGKPLITLKDAAAYITRLPETEQHPAWMAAVEALILEGPEWDHRRDWTNSCGSRLDWLGPACIRRGRRDRANRSACLTRYRNFFNSHN